MVKNLFSVIFLLLIYLKNITCIYFDCSNISNNIYFLRDTGKRISFLTNIRSLSDIEIDFQDNCLQDFYLGFIFKNPIVIIRLIFFDASMKVVVSVTLK